jgi:hypothetical protein
MMDPMAGKRPWGAGVFAVTAVAALALFAGRAGIPAVAAGVQPSRVILAVSHQPTVHALTARTGWQFDGDSPGRPATAAFVVALLMLCTLPLRRTRVAPAPTGSLRWARGPPLPAAHPSAAGR